MSDILLTVRDVAAILQSGEDAVIRRFAKMDGVIDLGSQSERRNQAGLVVGVIVFYESRNPLLSDI